MTDPDEAVEATETLDSGDAEETAAEDAGADEAAEDSAA